MSYNKPPIETAVVDFRFKTVPEWDPTIPGKFHAHQPISTRYSGTPKAHKIFETAVQTVPDHPPAIAVREGTGSVELSDKEGKKLITIGKEGLTVIVKKPYDGWAMFRERVQEALCVYQEYDSSMIVTRVGVRYTNKISLPILGQNISSCIEKYFLCGLGFEEKLRNNMSKFTVRTDHKFKDNCILILNFASLGRTLNDQHDFLLDLDVFKGNLKLSKDNEIMEIVEDLHGKEGKVFEDNIKDDLRELMNAAHNNS